MISNEATHTRRRAGGHDYRQRPPFSHRPPADRPGFERTPDEVIATEEVRAERKGFKLTLRKNAAGQFVRVDEFRGQKHNSIIIPIEAVEPVRDALAKLQEQQP